MADPHSTFYPYPPNPNPQPQFIQPHASHLSAPPVYLGIQMTYPNPTEGSQTWVPDQAVYGYSIPNAIQPSLETPLPITSSSNQQISNAHKRKPNPKGLTKISQTVRCEICDIYCTGIGLYEKHVSGKKHLKTLTKKYAPQTAPSQKTPLSRAAVSRHGMEGASSRAADEGLDAKRQKLMESGVVEESVPACSSGNVGCKSDVSFADHIVKEKHILQGATTSNMDGHDNNGVRSMSPGEDLGTKKQKLIQSGVAAVSIRVCTACNIVCNSEVVFADHIAGKKHIAQVQKCGDVASGSVPNLNQLTPPPAKKTPEDIDSKRQNIERSGKLATSVRVCTLCNVVCNSDSVFNSHIAGQKHASMVKKMAQTFITPAVLPAASS